MTQHRSRRNLPSPFFPIGTTSRMMHRSLRSARHRRNNANKPITSILRNRRLRVGEWRGAERCRAKERERERKESKERKSTIGGRGGGEAMRERRERERRWARNIGTECMHDALGNDIDIMAEPTKWRTGRRIGTGAPSRPHRRRATGVIIQANKGRSRQDYRVSLVPSAPLATLLPRNYRAKLLSPCHTPHPTPLPSLYPSKDATR